MTLQLNPLSLEFVRVPVSATGTGPVDPTADLVEMAIVAENTLPDVGDWQTATWETIDGVFYAKLLVGPGGTIELDPGQYRIYVRVQDSPERPVLDGGPLIVLDVATDPPFCTLDDLQLELGCDVDEAQALRLLRAATAAIRDWCGQPMTRREDEELTLDPNPPDTRVLVVPRMPVESVTSVTLDRGNGPETLTEATDYEWSAAGLLRRRWSTWGHRYRSIVVTLTSGYATIPDDIKAVCLGLAVAHFTNPAGVRSEAIGTYNVTYDGDSLAALSPADKATLGRYRVTDLA